MKLHKASHITQRACRATADADQECRCRSIMKKVPRELPKNVEKKGQRVKMSLGIPHQTARMSF